MPENTTLALSVSDIVSRVLAASALRHLLDDRRPALLHADHSDALRPVVRSCFAEICLKLASYALDCNLDDRDAEILTLGLSLPQGASAAILRSVVERAVVSATLAEAYRGTDGHVASGFEAESRYLLDIARRCLADASFAAAPPSITPHMF